MKRKIELHRNILAGKRRTITSNKTLGRSLAFIAGAINAGGFMAVGQYTSHMTGIASLAADNIALSQWAAATSLLLYILCFICGATTTTILIIWGRNHNLHSRYAFPLAIEAILLIIFGLMNSNYIFTGYYSLPYVIALLCFLMGLQNATITKITDTNIRTTHITGMSTDIGIELGRIIYSITGKKLPQTQYNQDKILLHLSIVLLFLLGGIIGAYGFKYFGFIFVLPLALYLLFLAFFPIWKDFTAHKYLYHRKKRR